MLNQEGYRLSHVMLYSLALILPFLSQQVQAGSEVTFTTYTDDECTLIAESKRGNSPIVDLDYTIECNPTPDSSISELECYSDGIRYTNHP